ncbi:TenA family protein, partial [Bacteroidales bacterium OttesenSCG-928-K03]|nr:TenA family protein [Bacteroidales bacterium OttesenSCG-928-K03]
QRLTNPQHKESFLQFVQDSIYAEQAMQSTMLKDVKLDKMDMTPTCRLYTSYLLSTMTQVPVEVAAAAILPCFWIYMEVGNYIFKNQKPNNPYQDWINMYSDEGFAVSNARAIEICDELAANSSEAQQQEMINAFILAAKMEWMFWDSAYKLEEWPL